MWIDLKQKCFKAYCFKAKPNLIWLLYKGGICYYEDIDHGERWDYEIKVVLSENIN